MKIYIDNVLVRFGEIGEGNDFKEFSFDDFFNLYPDVQNGIYLIKTFEREKFLSYLPNILTRRPEASIQIVFADTGNLDIYKEIVEAYSAEPAAGGFVKNEDKYLMIRRLGKWDLPKGKIEKGEDPETAALREVEEECGVKAKSMGWLCDTHHMYIRKNQLFIKKTSWFLMENKDDSNMEGQEEEGITEVNWYDRKMLETNLIHSYGNIEDVFLNFLRVEKAKAGKG